MKHRLNAGSILALAGVGCLILLPRAEADPAPANTASANTTAQSPPNADTPVIKEPVTDKAATDPPSAPAPGEAGATDSAAPPTQPEAATPPAPAEIPTPAPTTPASGLTSILGKDVKAVDSADSIGKITDVLVDASGRVGAAIIDVGGFLGVGSRKIAVDWKLLQFDLSDKKAPITVQLDRAALQQAPGFGGSQEPSQVVGAAPAPAPLPAPAVDEKAIANPDNQPPANTPTAPAAPANPDAKPADAPK